MASVQNHYRKYLKQFAFQQKSQEKVLQKIFDAKNLTRVKVELSIYMEVRIYAVVIKPNTLQKISNFAF